MQFIDEIVLEVQAGAGGDGSAAMRRARFRPLGGPAGGDGGRGGNVVLLADERITTLLDLKYRRIITANSGENGRSKDQYGKGGEDQVIRLPVGTQVFDANSGEQLADMNQPGQRLVIAQGGQGGRGNLHFVTSTERAPTKAEPGEPGQHVKLRLELKLLADVGIVGFPNVGKSTFIATVSKARPKVADYPFTTLTPNLGVVSRGVERNFVLADIPGIIEGAAEGAGLGHRFLKHVERTRVLLHMLSVDPTPGRGLMEDYNKLNAELARFDARLASRPSVVAVSKLDLPEAQQAYEEFAAALKDEGVQVIGLSSATGEGVETVLNAVEEVLAQHPVATPPRPQPLPTAADRPHGPPIAADED